MWLTTTLGVKPVIYAYATPVFGNQAAKERMESLGLQVYDVNVEGDPIPAIWRPLYVRIGNGATPPQLNLILSGPVNQPTLRFAESSVIPWLPNPALITSHLTIYTYLPMLENVVAGQNGGVSCTYNESSVRHDPLKACAKANTMCVKNGVLVPCGAEGWCGSNGVCVSQHMPYNCTNADDCGVGSMCMTPGYHLPATSFDGLTEPCKPNATCSLNPWDLTKYCWNR